jgi:hypothetical protein
MSNEKILGADAAAVVSAGSIDTQSATARHTAGPWMAEFSPATMHDEDGFWEIAPIGADGHPDWTREVACLSDCNEANAHLIAAAPELLEALVSLTEDFDLAIGGNPNAVDAMWARVKAALAKAEGRS